MVLKMLKSKIKVKNQKVVMVGEDLLVIGVTMEVVTEEIK